MITITLPRATVEQALEALAPWMDSDHTVQHAAYHALRTALAQQAEPVSVAAAMRDARLNAGWGSPPQQPEPVEPVACGDLEERKALSSVKLPCDVRIGHGTHRKGSSLLALVVRSRSLYQMAKSGDYYGYAVRLAVAIWEKHYKETAPHWKPLDDLVGVLTQIDNMAAGMIRLAQQAEPVLQGPVRIKPGSYTLGATWVGGGGGSGGVGAPPQQAEPDHETRAELAEQQVVQLAEERDHYRNLWQKAQQAEPVEPAFHGFMSADGTRVDVCFTPSAPRSDGAYATAYYTTPPQRKPLTDEEIQAAWDSVDMRHPRGNETRIAFARAVERAHGIPKP